jgi:large subunit ribosomal protein L22
MKIRAEQKNSRQSPRKVRLIANQVKDLPLEEAFKQLALIEQKAALVILKTLRQAVANATHNHQLKFGDLEIDQILVKTGPTYKRWQPVARGRAHQILKRTAHIEVVLKTKDQAGAKQSVNKRPNYKQNKSIKTNNQQKKLKAVKKSEAKSDKS